MVAGVNSVGNRLKQVVKTIGLLNYVNFSRTPIKSLLFCASIYIL